MKRLAVAVALILSMIPTVCKSAPPIYYGHISCMNSSGVFQLCRRVWGTVTCTTDVNGNCAATVSLSSNSVFSDLVNGQCSATIQGYVHSNEQCFISATAQLTIRLQNQAPSTALSVNFDAWGD